MKTANRVFPLTITVLSPLHIDSGSRLVPDVDAYAEGETVYVVDSDVAIELVAQRWEDSRKSYDQILRDHAAKLDSEEMAIAEAASRLERRIEQFNAHPPKQPQAFKKEDQRLDEDIARIRERRRWLKEGRTSPPPPPNDTLPDAIVQNSGLTDLLKTGWLTLDDLRGRVSFNGRPLVRYAMAGRVAAAEIYAQIKDVADRPYIPGSSLKGAVRSALAWDRAGSLSPSAIQQIGNGPKNADNDIEREIFNNGRVGPDRQKLNDTLRDVLRTLHVGDSTPATVSPELLSVAIFNSSSQRNARLAVEAIPEGATLQATLQVERYPFENAEAKKVITFGDWQKHLAPEELARACRDRARDLIEGERAYFDGFPAAAEILRFYQRLAAQLDALGPRAFMLPVGWGAGWRSKTLDSRLRADEEGFADTVQRFKLKKHKSPTYKPGDRFPDTRKLAMRGAQPHWPLGWLLVEIGEEKGR